MLHIDPDDGSPTRWATIPTRAIQAQALSMILWDTFLACMVPLFGVVTTMGAKTPRMSSLNSLIYLVGSWGYLRVSTLMEMKNGMMGLNNDKSIPQPHSRFIFYNAVV
jgi:hypothetical protein